MSKTQQDSVHEETGYDFFFGQDVAPIRLVLHTPTALHAVVDEILYREEITLKRFVRDALGLKDKVKEFSEDEIIQINNNLNALGKEFKHSSVYISHEEYKSIKAIKHYQKIDIGLLVSVSMLLFIKDTYLSKYPDIDRITDIANVITDEHGSNEA
jgi:hypothetical protein